MTNDSWYTLIQTRQQFDEMWGALADEPLVGVDTETTGLDWWRHVIVGASFANRTHAWYMPVRHVEGNCPIEWLWEAGERLEGRPICGHNFGGFDMHMLTRERWKLRPHWHDSMIAAYCHDENQELKLEEVASRYLNFDGSAEERDLYLALAQVLGKKKTARADKALMYRLPPVKVAPYASRDALSSRQAIDVILPILRTERLYNTYCDLIEYQHDLHHMVENGVPCNLEALNRADEKVIARRDELRQRIIEESGGTVENPNSNPQLARWCGTTTVAAKKLKKVLADPECDETLPPKIELISELRQYEKATGTYLSVMRESLDHGILHPALKLTGAVVRLSCGRPPMQGIPRYDELKPKPAYDGIKECVIAPEGYSIIEFDLSQAEIVVAAHYSQDPLLLQVIREGKSLHDITALRTGLPRDTAKALNLMAQYGCGAERYSEHRLIPIEQGKAELKAYLASFAQRTKFFRFVMNKAQETGKVELWTGRTRHFNETVKPHSAPNNLIQGAVSECIRVATRRIAAKVPEFKMGLTVHDSILGICRTELVPQIAPEVIRLMSDWPWMNPCLTADCKAGPSWATAKKVKTHA